MRVKKVDLQENMNEYNKYKSSVDYYEVLEIQSNGGFAFAHKKADLNDLSLNTEIATILAKNGDRVLIRSHKKTGKNPELEINGELSDIKTPKKENSINNGFSHAQAQGINTFVSDLRLNHTRENLIYGIKNGFRHNKYINSVKFVKKQTVVEITRKMYESGDYKKEIQKLF
ncbi:MAG: hypothetical protein EAZ06_01040 [Cytophagales bacterium]|nr:MAG: hypothetical protein EAZ06_01040 [Cytophagales bacterium]